MNRTQLLFFQFASLIRLFHSPTTVGSKSTNTARGTCFPAPVSLKNVLKESSPPPIVLSLGIWPSGWIPCSRQYNSQQAFPIWTPAWPTWTEIHSRCFEVNKVSSQYNKNAKLVLWVNIGIKHLWNKFSWKYYSCDKVTSKNPKFQLNPLYNESNRLHLPSLEFISYPTPLLRRDVITKIKCCLTYHFKMLQILKAISRRNNRRKFYDPSFEKQPTNRDNLQLTATELSDSVGDESNLFVLHQWRHCHLVEQVVVNLFPRELLFV